MKTKSGFLLAEETLKIVIAFICITFLIYFLVSLYFSKIDAIKMDQASRTLIDSPESIQKTIDNMKNGETRDFVMDNPAGWYLFSFTGNTKPNSCAGESCLCICDKIYAATAAINYIIDFKSQAKKCDEKNSGVCVPEKNFAKQDISVPIDGITKISIIKSSGAVLINKK